MVAVAVGSVEGVPVEGAAVAVDCGAVAEGVAGGTVAVAGAAVGDGVAAGDAVVVARGVAVLPGDAGTEIVTQPWTMDERRDDDDEVANSVHDLIVCGIAGRQLRE